MCGGFHSQSASEPDNPGFQEASLGRLKTWPSSHCWEGAAWGFPLLSYNWLTSSVQGLTVPLQKVQWAQGKGPLSGYTGTCLCAHLRPGVGTGRGAAGRILLFHSQQSPSWRVHPVSRDWRGRVKGEKGNPRAGAGWAGSPELVKHDSPLSPWGGARTWGPCSVITEPNSPRQCFSELTGAGLELQNWTLQG